MNIPVKRHVLHGRFIFPHFANHQFGYPSFFPELFRQKDDMAGRTTHVEACNNAKDAQRLVFRHTGNSKQKGRFFFNIDFIIYH